MPAYKDKEVEIEVIAADGSKQNHKKTVPFPSFSDLQDVLKYATENPTVQKPKGRNTDQTKVVTLSPEMSIVKGYQATVHARIRLTTVNALELEFGGFDKVLQSFANDIFQKRQKIGKPITMEQAIEKARAELAS